MFEAAEAPPMPSSAKSTMKSAHSGEWVTVKPMRPSTQSARSRCDQMSTRLYGKRSTTGPTRLRPKNVGRRLTAKVVAVASGESVRS